MKRRLGQTLTIFLLLLVASVSMRAMRAKAGYNYRCCKSNLIKIATACEMYATDFEGHYPARLSILDPKYLKSLPQCPLNIPGTQPYGYQVNPHAFTVVCQGDNHIVYSGHKNWPQYGTYFGCAMFDPLAQ